MSPQHTLPTKESSLSKNPQASGTLKETVAELNHLQNTSNNSPQVGQLKVLQKYMQKNSEVNSEIKQSLPPNGLPAQLKSGVENLSGVSLDDVKVNYDSSQPSQMGAAAFAKGSEIHVGPGQEQHLPHEAWHVVQQKKGRVKPTAIIDNTPINDNAALEKEADIMGAKAATNGEQLLQKKSLSNTSSSGNGVYQYEKEDENPVLDNGMTAVNLASNVNEKVSGAFGEEGMLDAGLINDNASAIAGNVFSGLTSTVEWVQSGANLWQEKDWESGADFFIKSANMADSILGMLATSNVMAEVPVLGPSIAAFESAMNVFKSNKALSQLREFEKGKTLDKDDQMILNKYVSNIKFEMGSSGIDFLLSIGEAVGSFFPPIGTGFKIVKGVKSIFTSGLEAWRSYKASKEEQALVRITGNTEMVDDASLDKMENLSKKVNNKEGAGLEGGSLMNLVNLKFDLNEVENELKTTSDATRKTELETRKSTISAKLTAGVAQYNSIVRSVDPSDTITLEDISNIQAIHASVIEKVLLKVNEEKSILSKFRTGLSWISSSILPEKERIVNEIWGDKGLPDEIPVQELSKGQHAAYFWDKTKEALELASKGRNTFSKKELNKKMKTILQKYKVPEDQIKMIVSE
jgi:hypothetical protein